MNKRGQLGFLFLILLAMIWILALFASTNPQKSFMNDCKNNYREDFRTLESTCKEGNLNDFFNNSLKDVPCFKIDRKGLERFCLDKYSSNSGKVKK